MTDPVLRRHKRYVLLEGQLVSCPSRALNCANAMDALNRQSFRGLYLVFTVPDIY